MRCSYSMLNNNCLVAYLLRQLSRSCQRLHLSLSQQDTLCALVAGKRLPRSALPGQHAHQAIEHILICRVLLERGVQQGFSPPEHPPLLVEIGQPVQATMPRRVDALPQLVRPGMVEILNQKFSLCQLLSFFQPRQWVLPCSFGSLEFLVEDLY